MTKGSPQAQILGARAGVEAPVLTRTRGRFGIWTEDSRHYNEGTEGEAQTITRMRLWGRGGAPRLKEDFQTLEIVS